MHRSYVPGLPGSFKLRALATKRLNLGRLAWDLKKRRKSQVQTLGSEFAFLFNGLGIKTTLVGVSCGTSKQISSFIFLPIARCCSNWYPSHSGAKSRCA